MHGLKHRLDEPREPGHGAEDELLRPPGAQDGALGAHLDGVPEGRSRNRFTGWLPASMGTLNLNHWNEWGNKLAWENNCGIRLSQNQVDCRISGADLGTAF